MFPSLIGPTVLRVMIRPLFGPSRTRHFTCLASPCIPVMPMISMTSAAFCRLPWFTPHALSAAICFEISSTRSFALPALTIAAAAEPTSRPLAEPMWFCFEM